MNLNLMNIKDIPDLTFNYRKNFIVHVTVFPWGPFGGEIGFAYQYPSTGSGSAPLPQSGICFPITCRNIFFVEECYLFP